MCDGALLGCSSSKAWFHLSAYIIAENKRYWSSENPKMKYGVRLHGTKFHTALSVQQEFLDPLSIRQKFSYRFTKSKSQEGIRVVLARVVVPYSE